MKKFIKKNLINITIIVISLIAINIYFQNQQEKKEALSLCFNNDIFSIIGNNVDCNDLAFNEMVISGKIRE